MTHPIIVTGPQRAGSRLASHIIARQTGRKFIDELEYNINIPNNCVVQAPFLLKAVIELSFIFPNAQFAFMIRDKDDIIASMQRIEWYKDYTDAEKNKPDWLDLDNPDFYSTYVDHCYDYIGMLKQSLDKERWFDIQYESLQYDPLFVKDRADFTVKQHLPFTPNGPITWRNDEYIRTAKG